MLISRGWKGRVCATVLAACCLLLTAFAAGAADDSSAAVKAFAAVQRQRPQALQLPRSRFMVESGITSVVLAPDGTTLAWLQQRGHSREVWVRAIAKESAPRKLLDSTKAQALSWTADGRWLLLESPAEVFALAAQGQTGSGLVTPLGGSAKREFRGLDRSQPAAILIIEQQGRDASGAVAGWSLVRVDMQGKRTPLWHDRQQIIEGQLDAQGRLAWLQRVEGTALVLHRVRGGALHPVLRCADLHRCRPLATQPDGSLLLLSDQGADLTALQTLSIDGHRRTLLGEGQGGADVDDVVLDPATGQPRFVAWRSDAARLRAVTPADAVSLATLQVRLPARDLALQVAGSIWLVEERASNQQGRRWHLFNPRTQALEFQFDDALQNTRDGRAVEPITPALTAAVLPVQWRASDGLMLHGWLTLPPGRDAATLPLVVNVHGGPWNHWGPQYRATPQLLANRGYAVFEPNPRASTGFGRHYAMAGGSDFGNGRVQQDIVEGTRWLLAQGVGDATRVGITGASFGGYSTLLGLTFQPELYKVGVATVPPPDFGWVLRWILRNPEALQLSNVVPMRDWSRMMGLDTDDAKMMQRLHTQSPLAQAGRMKRPLLIAAGGQDQRVGIAGVIEYAARLKLAGADASLLIDADAGHSNRQPLAREATLFAMEQLFHAHLGGAAPQPPDREVRAYLRDTLRMSSTDFAVYARPEVAPRDPKTPQGMAPLRPRTAGK